MSRTAITLKFKMCPLLDEAWSCAEKLLTDINLPSLMPDKGNNFGGSLVSDFRKWWRHVQPKHWSPNCHNSVERYCISNHAMNPSSLTANSQGGSDELTMKDNQSVSPSNVGKMGRDRTGRETEGPWGRGSTREVDWLTFVSCRSGLLWLSLTYWNILISSYLQTLEGAGPCPFYRLTPFISAEDWTCRMLCFVISFSWSFEVIPEHCVALET